MDISFNPADVISDNVISQIPHFTGKAIFELDKNGRLLFVNEEAATLFGQPSKSLIRKLVWGRFHNPVNGFLCQVIEQSLYKKAILDEVLTYPASTIELHIQAIPSSSGAIVMISTLSKDSKPGINWNKHIQEEIVPAFHEQQITYEGNLEKLRDSKDLLQSVFDVSLTGIAVLESIRNDEEKIIDFKLTLINESGKKRLGVNLTGKNLLDVLPDGLVFFEMNKQVVETGVPFDIERNYEGELVKGWFRITAVKLGDGLVVCFDDIGIRKHNEQELSNLNSMLSVQNKLFEQAEQVANTGSWIWNLDTNVVHYSDNCYRIYGMEPQSHAPGWEAFNKYVHKDDFERLSNLIKKMSVNEQPSSTEYRIITTNGDLRYIRANNKLYITPEGERTMIGNIQDITEPKMAEQELIQLKLSQQSEILNAVLLAQEFERERIGEGLHNGVAQLLYAVKIKNELLKVADPGNTQKLLKEIDSVLSDAIKETRNISFELVPTALKDFGLEHALTALFQKIAKPGLQISFNASALNDRLSENIEIGIYRIIQELVNNIIKHSRATKANVKINNEGGTILVVVRDNGEGFNQKQVSQEQKGIGLQNIKNRAKLLNAKLKIDSSPSKGTRVSIDIPA